MTELLSCFKKKVLDPMEVIQVIIMEAFVNVDWLQSLNGGAHGLRA
jgi:hypothetical protein